MALQSSTTPKMRKSGSCSISRRTRLEEFFSPKEVAQRLSLDRRSVYRAIDRGELRAHKFGGVLRISSGDLGEWVKRCST